MQTQHSFQNIEFSYQTRKRTLNHFKNHLEHPYDLLIVGGGITGSAVALEAAQRGLRVALVEKGDFASGTSSRSSKLIHGGLRYLKHFELDLVFEALSERAHLLKNVSHLVKPLSFLIPVLKSKPFSRIELSLGLWLYDLLALFRTPKMHGYFSKKKLLKKIPFLNQDLISGGFQYADAMMWDDLLTVETLRAAKNLGAQVVNYVEAETPIWSQEKLLGFQVQDLEQPQSASFPIYASYTIFCTGAWTDLLGKKLIPTWKPKLKPSQGIHLVFSLKDFPIDSAIVLSAPHDQRIAFAIPRPDFGTGMVLVGTTDHKTDPNPDHTQATWSEIQYLLKLLHRFFPKLHLNAQKIRHVYAGVRPLVGQSDEIELQNISREHWIKAGPVGSIFVAGGKYTTHRSMAHDIVRFTLKKWNQDFRNRKIATFPKHRTHTAIKNLNPAIAPQAISELKKKWKEDQALFPLLERYGLEAIEVIELQKKYQNTHPNLPGFPYLYGTFAYSIRKQMVMELEDFYFRRSALFLANPEHGLSVLPALLEIFSKEKHLNKEEKDHALKKAQLAFKKALFWKTLLPPSHAFASTQATSSHRSSVSFFKK